MQNSSTFTKAIYRSNVADYSDASILPGIYGNGVPCLSTRRTETPMYSGDRIFARVVSHGSVIYEACIEGAHSIEEVLRKVCKAVASLGHGLMKLALRNSTQGWAINRNLNISRRPPMPEGTQLTFAF